MIQSHQSESLCLRVCDGWVGKSKKKKKKKKIPCWSPVKIGSANEMKTDQGRRMGEGRTSSWNNNKPKKREFEPYTYKDRLLFLFYIDPLKMCPYLSLSIDHDAKKKKSLSLSLCLQSRYCALVLSQQSHSRGKVFLFFDLPASQKNNK